jgi:RNA polymerase sigma-70 factor (ECF subfamily)
MELSAAVEHERHVTDDSMTSHAVSDESLWRASADGDERAFSELYERHAGAIYNYLFRRLADWSEAEDLTAVVFMEAFRRRRDVVVHEGKVLPWLYGIATNVLRNRRRALWRHRRLVEQLAGERGEIVMPDAPRAPRPRSRCGRF